MLKMKQLPPLNTSRGTSGFFDQESNPLQMDTFFEAAGIAPSLGGSIPSVLTQRFGQMAPERDYLGLSVNQWLIVGGAVLVTAVLLGSRR